MRDILFKAKSENEDGTFDWIEGYLSKCDGKWTICDDEGCGCFVEEDTICQYTGLTDKNGNKIWENDIFKHYNKRDVLDYKSYEIGVVKWDETKCRYINYRVETNEIFNLNLICDYEVIGNIFDNAELLEG